MASITKFLAARMRLQVNAEKSAVRHPSKVHFLGFRFLLRQDGQIGVLLSAKTERRLAATIREMTPPNWGRSITSCMDGLSRYLTGWMAHYRLCSPDAVKGSGRSRRSHPPPDQGDHRAPEEASALSSAASPGAWGEPHRPPPAPRTAVEGLGTAPTGRP